MAERQQDSNIRQMPEGILLSITQAAREFGTSRETVKKRLAESNVRASCKRNGYEVFRLSEVAPAMLSEIAANASAIEPDLLPPRQRKDYYQSEDFRLKTEKAKGNLCEAEDVRDQYAKIIKPVASTLEIIPDLLERDAGLTNEQLEKTVEILDEVREYLAQELEKDEPFEDEEIDPELDELGEYEGADEDSE